MQFSPRGSRRFDLVAYRRTARSRVGFFFFFFRKPRMSWGRERASVPRKGPEKANIRGSYAIVATDRVGKRFLAALVRRTRARRAIAIVEKRGWREACSSQGYRSYRVREFIKRRRTYSKTQFSRRGRAIGSSEVSLCRSPDRRSSTIPSRVGTPGRDRSY